MRLPFASRPLPPMLRVGAAVAGDFVSTLAFALIFSLSHSLVVSLAAGLLLGVLGVAWTRARGHAVDPIQWLSLGLVVVFGGAGLLTHDARFVMFKPTVIYLAVAAVMLKPGWMRRYLPPKAQGHGLGVSDAFGYVWSAAMAALAIANLALALHGDVRLWGGFLAVAPLALKLTLGVAQYVLTRRSVIRAIRREQAHGASAAASEPPASPPVNAVAAR